VFMELFMVGGLGPPCRAHDREQLLRYGRVALVLRLIGLLRVGRPLLVWLNLLLLTDLLLLGRLVPRPRIGDVPPRDTPGAGAEDAVPGIVAGYSPQKCTLDATSRLGSWR